MVLEDAVDFTLLLALDLTVFLPCFKPIQELHSSEPKTSLLL